MEGDGNGDRVLVAIPGHDWDTTVEHEVPAIGGYGGIALGLPPNLSKALYRASRMTADSGVGELAEGTPERKVPPYRSYVQLDSKVQQIIERMVTDAADGMDLDGLRIAALAAAA